MKKNIIKLMSVIGIVILAYIFYFQVSPIKSNIRGAAVLTVSQEQELDTNSQLIVLATMLKNEKDEIMYDSANGVPYFGYTKTSFQVDKILKGEYKGKLISVNEPYFAYTNPLLQKTITYIDEYVPTIKGNQYILYLTQYEDFNDYFLTANFQGKFPISAIKGKFESLDTFLPQQIESSKQNFDSSYKKLYSEVVKKYGFVDANN